MLSLLYLICTILIVFYWGFALLVELAKMYKRLRDIPLRVSHTDFDKLTKLKGAKTWEQFIVDPIIKDVEG